MESISKKISVIILVLFCCFVVGAVIMGINNTIKEGEQVNNTINEPKKEEPTIETELKKIKTEFSSCNIEMINSYDSEYSTEAESKQVKEAISSMQKALLKYNKISNRWSTYVNTYYDKWKGTSPREEFHMSFNCNINDLSSQEDVKGIFKDCAEIIWESMDIIYSNSQSQDNKDNYFSKLDYYFTFNYDYIDSYGNKKSDKHSLSFEIERNTYNKINKETFPKIIEMDYTKLFDLGKTYSSIGKNGIKIDFNNMLKN